MKRWLFCAFMMSNAALADVAVVVHPSNQNQMDAEYVSRLFLNKAKSFPGGESAQVYSLSEGSAETDLFNEQVLGKSASQLKAFWSKLIFTGKGQPPKALESSDKLVSLVASEPGAIGYVDAAAVNDSVRVVMTLK